MAILLIVGEGPTEEAFVKHVLKPVLAAANVIAKPLLIPTSKSGSGGALNLDRVTHYLCKTLRANPEAYVSTQFDLYGLDSTFPGVVESRGYAPSERASRIENELASIIVRAAECRQERFLPFVQPHEFEALLFSDVQHICQANPQWMRYQPDLERIRHAYATPEHINDSPATAPSKRLENLLKPSFKKKTHGPVIAGRIGLDTLRAACPHFGAWINKLTALQPL